jgi:opacity protein-like surface antigen
MKQHHARLALSMIVTVGVTLVLVGAPGSVQAQDRADRWELGLGALVQFGTDLDANNGSEVNTKDELGFVINGGYNFTDRLATTFGFQWVGVGYDADIVQDDGETARLRGSYDAWVTSANLVFHLFEAELTPYVGAGIGWTWIDTNVPTGPPITGCWWDPWWGYVCSTRYPTATTSAFSYQATAGVRYDFGYSSFFRLGYTSQWQSLSDAEGTPRFDVLTLEFGWMF